METKTLQLEEVPGAQPGDAATTYVDGCHILAMQGHATGLAGQLTLRDGDSARMYTLALGTGFDEASADQVLLVDANNNTLQGQGKPNPGVRFHAWIYKHYPHVRAIAHTHPPALSAFSMLGKPLPVAHMDAAMFHEDCGYLDRWPGVPTGDEEGRLIAAAMGGKRCALLTNHGIVCAGASLQEAIYLNVFAERAARMALDALAAGDIQPVEPAAAAEAHDFLLQPAIVNATFAYWARQARRRMLAH